MILCAICMLLEPMEFRLADTYVNGTAVCVVHVHHFRGPTCTPWDILNELARERALHPKPPMW